MKKLFVLICLAFLLVGCSSNNSTKVSNGDELLWSGPKESYTKQDLYEDMKSANNYSDIISSAVLKTMAEVDGIDMEAEIKALEEQYDSYIEVLGEYAVSYFGDKEHFVNAMLADNLVTRYLKNDIEENFDQYVNENNPYYGEIFYVSDEEMAKDIESSVKEGSNTVEFAASDAGYTEAISPKVYTDKSDLPVEVKEVALNNEAPYFTILPVDTYAKDSNGETTTSTRYYVINIMAKDVNEFKDSFIDTLTSDTDNTEFIQQLINKHDIRFHDQSAYESFSSVYEGAK